MGDRSKLKEEAGKEAENGKRRIRDVPRPSTDPATNLLIADVALGAMASFFHRKIKQGMVRTRDDAKEAQGTGQGRKIGQSLAQFAAARIAARSIPGAILVTGALLGKAAFDRSQSKRRAQKAGREASEEQADDA